MVATWTEGLDALINLFQSDWNRGNTSNYRPVVLDIADTTAEKGKRLDLDKHDYVLLCETAHNEGGTGIVLRLHNDTHKYHGGCPYS